MHGYKTTRYTRLQFMLWARLPPPTSHTCNLNSHTCYNSVRAELMYARVVGACKRACVCMRVWWVRVSVCVTASTCVTIHSPFSLTEGVRTHPQLPIWSTTRTPHTRGNGGAMVVEGVVWSLDCVVDRHNVRAAPPPPSLPEQPPPPSPFHLSPWIGTCYKHCIDITYYTNFHDVLCRVARTHVTHVYISCYRRFHWMYRYHLLHTF